MDFKFVEAMRGALRVQAAGWAARYGRDDAHGPARPTADSSCIVDAGGDLRERRTASNAAERAIARHWKRVAARRDVSDVPRWVWDCLTSRARLPVDLDPLRDEAPDLSLIHI